MKSFTVGLLLGLEAALASPFQNQKDKRQLAALGALLAGDTVILGSLGSASFDPRNNLHTDQIPQQMETMVAKRLIRLAKHL